MTIVAMLVTVSSVAQFRLPSQYNEWDINHEEYLNYHSVVVIHVLEDEVIMRNDFVGDKKLFKIVGSQPTNISVGDVVFIRLDSRYKRKYTMENNVEFIIKKDEYADFRKFITDNLKN